MSELRFHSMKQKHVDRATEDSSVPVLTEMSEENLQAFAAHERSKPQQLVINVQSGKMGDGPIIALCITAVCPASDFEAILRDVTESLHEAFVQLAK